MPERVAAIDVGSNAIRFFAAEADGREGFHVLGETRVAVRLGHGVFSSGQIEPSAAAEAVAGLVQAARQMTELSIERYRAVATSAVRESRNRRAFVRQVSEASGLRLEVISGSEEIRLVHAAVRRRMALGKDTWFLVELGGGSVEIALVDDARVSWSETHAMGAVRLMEMFVRGSSEPKEFSRLIQEYAETIRLPTRIGDRGAKGFVATGGNIESISRICQGTGSQDGGPRTLSIGEVREVIVKLSRMSAGERQKEYDLRADRADVIVPAAIIYAHLAERLGAAEIVIPGGGVREGIVYDLLMRPGVRRESQAAVVDNALLLGRKFLFDEKHALHVARLAGSLYDQLASVHGMGDRERRLLVTAALLHDVGGVVSLKSHHKHALYLIARSELPGFSAREMFIAGTVARYHRKAPPSPLHHEFAQLSLADRQRVRVLAGLLRIADALDKEHRQKIQGIKIVRTETGVQIKASGADDILLEQWALRKKDDLFREVFGLDVSLSRDGAGADG
jgi:exopolyphosphatase / guanosine-5'-triphosphate,3'-diphosphate pyrophosphatase